MELIFATNDGTEARFPALPKKRFTKTVSRVPFTNRSDPVGPVPVSTGPIRSSESLPVRPRRQSQRESGPVYWIQPTGRTFTCETRHMACWDTQHDTQHD